METRSVPQSSKNQTFAKEQTLKSQFDDTYKGHPGVENNEPSMTVPDMSYTVQELLLNHSRGIESNVKNYEGNFFGDHTPKTFDDITEQIAYQQDLLDRIEELEQEILEQQTNEKIKLTELSVPEQKT